MTSYPSRGLLDSSTRFSPLETLLSRYPNLHGNDLQLLDLPFEKGADFAGISEEVQDRMIELDYEEREMSLVVSQFETRLVRSFEEMDTAHQYIQVKERESIALMREKTLGLTFSFSIFHSSI